MNPTGFFPVCNSSSVILHLSLPAINGLHPRNTVKSYLRKLASQKDLRSRVHTQGRQNALGFSRASRTSTIFAYLSA